MEKIVCRRKGFKHSEETKRKIGLSNSKPKIKIYCHVCGNGFLVHPSRERKAKFCSYVCMGINQKNRVPWNKGLVGACKPNSGSFKKGIIPWMKGKHIMVNDALIKHMAKNGPWNKNKEFLKIKGLNHWNWKGGKTNESEKIRKSVKYKMWREAVFKRDDYTCVLCKRRGGSLNADHIKPFYKYRELRFELNNGRTLCVACHKKTETYGFKQYLYERRKSKEKIIQIIERRPTAQC
jgi:hypothetical protein